MKDPKEDTRPDQPDNDGDKTSKEVGPPQLRPEIPAPTPQPEIPPKPSRDVPQPDRERAENEGMVKHDKYEPERPAPADR